MARIDISARILGDQELAQALAKLSSHDIPKAIRSGVGDAARAGRTTLAKSIGQRYSLSAGRIKQDVPTARVAPDGQTAVITTSRKPITAMSYKARPAGKGVSMTIFRGQRTLVRAGFMQHSTTGAFAGTLPFRPSKTRPYRGDTKRKKPRAGLDILVGPSIHAIYTGGQWAPALQARTELRIEDALEKGILRSLGAMGRGFGRA